MIDTSPFRNTRPGLYTVYWKSGGSSLAAVGVTPNGGRWLAPINWVAPTEEPPWLEVLRMEPVDIRGPKAGGFMLFYSLVRRDPDGDVSLVLGGMSESIIVQVGGVSKVAIRYIPETARYQVARCQAASADEHYAPPAPEVFASESGAFERAKEMLAREVCLDGSFP